MSGHGGGGHESHGGGGKESLWEKFSIVGGMLNEIASVDGIKNFLNDMADHHILPVALKIFDPIMEFFGASGGGGGGGGHSHGH